MRLADDFREFIASLNAAEARYLVVGGYALAAHGLPRATGDLDVWVWTSPENASRVLDALDAFGFGAAGITATDVSSPGRVVQLGFPPLRIDVLTSIDGVDFDDAWDRRIVVGVGSGVEAMVIGRDDLVANKAASDRPQDRVDVARLTEEDG